MTKDSKKGGRPRKGQLIWRKSGWYARLTVLVDGERVRVSRALDTDSKAVARIKLARLLAAENPTPAEAARVVTFEDGTFFLTSRGLYMLPRGFGSPVPAGDMVMDTFASYPFCGGAQASIKPTEQTIRWVMMDGLVPVVGRQIVYDIAHKTWSVDWINEVGVGFNAPQVGIGQWYNGEVAMFPAALGYLKVSGSTFSDNGNAIAMSLTTGDVRPFGPISEGTISRVDLLAELRSACTLTVSKTTEFSTSPVASRVFSFAAGDYQFGQLAVTEAELGSTELREAMAVNVTWSESSTTEGLAVIAMSVEHEGSVGLKRVGPLSRVT